MTYATDGKCHNANHGTFNHECGKPATWVGMKANGFASGFCDHCKVHGDERHGYVRWKRVVLDARGQALLQQLIAKGVPMVKHVETNGWMLSTITKRDQFYRMNGKIIPRNWVNAIVRAGLATMEGTPQ